MRPPANKTKLHTDTYTRTYTDTDSDLSTIESTKTEPQEMLETSATTLIKLPFVCLFVCLFGEIRPCLVHNRGEVNKVWG